MNALAVRRGDVITRHDLQRLKLQPGDVLMLGVSAGAPLVHAGQTVAIEIEGVGRLENRFTADTLASGATA